MRIDAITDDPQQLTDAINKAIEEGDLKTWKKVENTEGEILYSHIPAQWDEKAMLKPELYEDKVRFNIKWWHKNEEPATAIKGYILGRFTEVLMVHFRNYFTHLEIFA